MRASTEESSLRAREARAEFETVVASKTFQRAPKLQRFLSYVGEMYFAGRGDEIKEYNIAVHALGRGDDFDPQLDPIVRVSAHALRKRLEQYYEGEGAGHSLRIELPVGQYVPCFTAPPGGNDQTPIPALSGDESTLSGETPLSKALGRRAPAWPLVAALVLLMAAIVWAWRAHLHLGSETAASGITVVPGNSVNLDHEVKLTPPLGTGFYELLSDGPSFTDHAGNRWVPATHCTGGTVFHHPDQIIFGTHDPTLFQNGRRSDFTCKFAAPPGAYELHLLFADTFSLGVAADDVSLAVNNVGPPYIWDILSDAGGKDRAIVKVLTGVRPEADGFIHLRMKNQDGYLCAVAILHGNEDGRMLPFRMVTAPNGYTDHNGQYWLPDQEFFGGTADQRKFPTQGAPDNGLYAWERFGRMQYDIPAAAGQRYTVRLYFSEGYFGSDKWMPGGAGRRVFSVSCNGQMLLPHFDIMTQTTPGHEALVKTFRHVRPSAMGSIVVDFFPEINYPLIDAIAVQSEGAPD